MSQSGSADLAAARQRAAKLDRPTRKLWTAPTLKRLGVGMDAASRYVFTITNEAGEYAGAVRYADDGRDPKVRADAGTTRDLWPRPEDVPGAFVVVVEGEPDAVSLAELGFPVVALPGAGKWSDEWPERIAHGRDGVYFVTDCDKTGRARMTRAAELAAPIADAFVIDMAPERDDGYDMGDVLVDLGPSMARRFLERLLTGSRPVERAASAAHEQPVVHSVMGERVAVVMPMSDVRIKPVRFLWRPWLPLGKVTLIAGAPGQGKSQLTSYMAGHTSRGTFEGSDVGAGRVVILTAEDDLADTVAPRLQAVNADFSRIDTVLMRYTMPEGVTVDGLVKLPGDVATLHTLLKKGDVRLVIFDPVASFVGRDHSTHINQDVRDVLDPIVSLAALYDVAIVVVLHLNKSEAKSWAGKIAESHAFQAVARTILALAPDPDDEDGDDGTDKILAATKLNLLRRGRGHALKLRVVPATVYADDGTPVETSRIELMGNSNVSADDLLADATERGVRREVLDFLFDTLADGSMASNDLKAEAKKQGVAWRSIQRYYREVCNSATRAKSANGVIAYFYELSADLERASTLGVAGALESTTPSAPGVEAQGGFPDMAQEGNGALGALPSPPVEAGQNSDELMDYRRRRDAMLGERWDDDEGDG